MGRVEGGNTPLIDFLRVLRLTADHTYLVTGGGGGSIHVHAEC